MYDYDTFYHMDFDYRQGPSGQFDGLTFFISNTITGNDKWQTIAKVGAFDGLNPEADQTGQTPVNAGTIYPVTIEIITGDSVL